MAEASASLTDEEQFWKLVWPPLKDGGWKCEGGVVDQGNNERSTAGANGRRTSARNRTSKGSSSGGSSKNNSGGNSSAKSSPSKSPLMFTPPAVGVASESLEEAMRRSAPADGSRDGERPDHLVGVDAVIELLTFVPGFPGTTSGITNFEAVAAAARGVMLRTPSPPTVATVKPPVGDERAFGSSSSRTRSKSRSSSVSSSDEAVTEQDRPVRMQVGVRSATADSGKLQKQALPFANTASVGRGAECAASDPNFSQQSCSLPTASSSLANSRAEAAVGEAGPAAVRGWITPATRLGRVVKKPVRLDQQKPGRQTLPGRSGRADAASKVAARAAAAAATVAAAGVVERGAGGQEAASGASAAAAAPTAAVSRNKTRAVVEVPTGGAGGAERCIARLGTAAVAGGDGAAAGNRNIKSYSRGSNGEAEASKRSSSAFTASSSVCGDGSVFRMALPAEGRSTGTAPREVAGEAGGAGDGTGDSVRKGTRVTGRERDRLVVPDPPPERPVGGLGRTPEDAITEYKRVFHNLIWPALAQEFGWTKTNGPRANDVYYLPRGIVRGQNGAKCRVNFFDSITQVLVHLAENEEKFSNLLERAWAAAIRTPRAIGKKGGWVSVSNKKKKRWTKQSKKEYPRKVSLVGPAHQVDPSNFPVAVSSEDYVSPEDGLFEQIWDSSFMLHASGGAGSPPDPTAFAQEFCGVVSYDKCLEILYRCGGDEGEAHKALSTLVRVWRARYPGSSISADETAAAKATVAREAAARLVEAPSPSPAARGSGSSQSCKASPGGDCGGRCPIVAGSTTVTATTSRSAVAWGSGAAASKGAGPTGGGGSARGSGGVSSGGGGGSASRGGRGQSGRAKTEVVQDACWYRPLVSLPGGDAALQRQVEGGVSSVPPGTRSRDKLYPDFNLSRPWSPKEAECFTQALLEEGSKNFYAVQKALPDRQICELVDRYYGGWKQTDAYKTLKESIRLSKIQSACGRCHAGGDLICCDGCDAVYHPECVGISVVPEGDWFCPTCSLARRNEGQRATAQSSSSATGAGGVVAPVLAPGAGPRLPGVKPAAVAGSKGGATVATGRNKRGVPMMAAAETAGAADDAAASSVKKPRTFVEDSGGTWESGGGGDVGGGGAPASGCRRRPAGGAQKPEPSSQVRMERVPIQLGSARGAVAGAATRFQVVLSGRMAAPAVVGATAAAKAVAPVRPSAANGSISSVSLGGGENTSGTSGQTKISDRVKPAAPAPPPRFAACGASAPGATGGRKIVMPFRSGAAAAAPVAVAVPLREDKASTERTDDSTPSPSLGGADTNASRAPSAASVVTATTAAKASRSPFAMAPRAPWACRACSTFNKRSLLVCVSCGTRREVKDVEEGKQEWWCCRRCSRFNSRRHDGDTCRICSAVEGVGGVADEKVKLRAGDWAGRGVMQEDEEDEGGEEEEDEEIISVGEEEISVGEGTDLGPPMSAMAASPAERFVQL